MSDKLFQKRKKRRVADLARKQAARQPYDKVLIVCEGSKTEPNYLIDLINSLKLSTANVEVDGSSGSDPVSVVERAGELIAHNRKQRGIDGYDRVFCVFDKDEHELHGNKFSQALNKIRQLKHPGIEFTAITSTPCFEVWLIMHFEPVTRPFSPTRGNTAAQETVRYLKQYLPDYEKGSQGLLEAIQPQTQQAMVYAQRLEQQNMSSGSDNPSTKMHTLVAYLQNLKN